MSFDNRSCYCFKFGGGSFLGGDINVIFFIVGYGGAVCRLDGLWARDKRCWG